MRRRSAELGLLAAMAYAATAGADPILDPIPQKIQKGTIVVELESVAQGLTAPNHAIHAGDGSGRLFVVDQTGFVRVVDGGALLPNAFLDVSARLTPPSIIAAERGFLGLAFHPGFADAQSPGFKKLYTYTSEPFAGAGTGDFGTTVALPGDPDHQSVIAEWTVNGAGDAVDTNTRREILRIDQPQNNHNGGALVFDDLGNLYVALGDGGNADDQGDGHGTGNAQDTSNVLGSILRIDPFGNDGVNGEYGISQGNPFVGQMGLDEIYAYGFRNPFRISFDTGTGDLIAADVGQGAIEEVDIVLSEGNYGWNLKEGSFAFDPNGSDPGFVTDDPVVLPPGLIDPVAEYDHDEGGAQTAIIGGFVYRGSAIPELIGKYVFGELSGRLFFADLATGVIQEFVIGLDDRALAPFVLGFGQDEAGELYLLTNGIPGPFPGLADVLKIVPVVPEPGIASLLALGLLALGLRRLT